MTRWILWLGWVAACGFGDNLQQHASSRHRCGDGVVDPGEACDDGNVIDGDGCSSTCAIETPHAVCGNGIRESGEGCDDGNTVDGDGCSSTCQVEQGSAACTLVPQSGCSGATPACDLTAAHDGSTACREVTKNGTSNDHCPLDTDCKTGFTCVGDGDANDEPWCSRMCEHDGDCTGVGSRCIDELTDAQGNQLDVLVCSNACDPFGQTGCPSQMGCIAQLASGGNFTDCDYLQNKTDGSSCTSQADCTGGSVCVGSNGNATCEPYCIVNGADTCSGSTTCMAFAQPLTIGATEYGVCL